MRIERHAWQSSHTGQEMQVVRYGNWGPPLIYVPTSEGNHEEFEAYGLDRDCAPWIDTGRVQLFAVEGHGAWSLFNDEIEPRERIQRYARFERYMAEELLPWARSVAENDRLGVAGASYGAFVAANLLFKFPRMVKLACGLGGVYALWHRLEGHHDDDVYFHTPLEYLPRLADAQILADIRATTGIMLFAAEKDPWLWTTLRLSETLIQKALPHQTRIWPAPADHHERWWKLQMRTMLASHY